MADQIIPITNDPSTVTLGLRVRYNTIANYWELSVSDSAGNLLLDSRPLLTGFWPAANILQQDAHLGIGSAFIINASGIAQDYPDQTNLGTDFLLLWSDTPTS